MKNSIAIFLGCVVIAIGIMIAGNGIAKRIPATLNGSFHGSLNSSGNQAEFSDYLNEYMAQWYLNIWNVHFHALLRSGELDGTYVQVGDELIFSRWRLSAWMERTIEAGTNLPSGYEIDPAAIKVTESEAEFIAQNALASLHPEAIITGYDNALLAVVKEYMFPLDVMRLQIAAGDTGTTPAPMVAPMGPLYRVAMYYRLGEAHEALIVYISPDTGEVIGAARGQG